MKYIQIIAPLEDGQRIFDFLQRRSLIELTKHEDAEGLSFIDPGRVGAQLDKNIDTVETALAILDKYAPESKGLIASFLDEKAEMTEAEFESRTAEADSVTALCSEICSLEKEAAEYYASALKLETAAERLEPWLALDIPMDFKGTASSAGFIGTIPGDKTAEMLLTDLAGILPPEKEPCIEVVSHSKERTCLFAFCHTDDRQEVSDALRSVGFAPVSEDMCFTPGEKLKEYSEQAEKFRNSAEENRKKIAELAPRRDEIKLISDYLNIRKEKYSALEKIGTGRDFILITGYIPEEKADKTVQALEEKFSAAVSVTDPPEDADVPVLLRNKPFAAAVESITSMYSMPGKDDVDPNPVMSIFYYMLFGIMLSDAGYGLLMALGTGIVKFKMKPKGNLKKTVDMYFWCGLATVFWGALFGSWFGDLPNVISSQFLGKGPLSVALWFEPVQDPMKLLLFSFLFGIIHLFAGVGISFYAMWKKGNKIGAICDCIPIYLLITGICPLAVGVIGYAEIPEWLNKAGIYMLIAGAVLIVLTAGRDSKNIIGKLGLGLYGLYNAASGWLGDILSYSRLLALGLCTGVIATVINTLGTIPKDPTVKLCLFIPVFIFGHIVNMAINLIGTYVHTNRLQYVEFFGKFYEGGGRSFTPLKVNTKYYNIKED